MTTVTDDFNRANGAVGAAWTNVPTGDGTPTWSIVSNKVRNTTTGGSFGKYCRHDTATGSADMYAQTVVTSTQANAGSNSGVMCRGQTGSTNTSYQFTGRHAGDTLSFWMINAGTETNLRLACNAQATAVSQTLSRAWASGDTIREEVIGSLLRGKINGALVAVTRDTTIAAGQRGGLNAYNAVGGELGEFDDFQAGLLDDLIAPYVAGVGVQVEGTGSLTPTIPANVAAGDLVLVHGTILSATNTQVVPAGEGWSTAQATAANAHGSQVFAKVWGLGGQTDDSTPTFTRSAGADGAAVTPVIIRNPFHATRPWTSVAAAVLAAGAQNNAASATVTAPSVSHTGDDRTVCRFFGSADDNSLGITTASLSNSEGALVYGGLDWNFSTAGAQALSILENVDLATSTGAATVTEHINSTDANHGITLVLGVPPAVIDLVVADAAHAQSTDAVALTQEHALPVADAGQAQAADAVALTQVHQLAVADASHDEVADGVALVQQHSLVVADAGQAHTAGSPALTQVHALAVADAAQAQTADGVTLSQVHVLVVQDAVHGQAADGVTLTVPGAGVDVSLTVAPTRLRSALGAAGATRSRAGVSAVEGTRLGAQAAATRSRAGVDASVTTLRDTATVTATRSRAQAEPGSTRLGADVGPTRIER